jgi:hypothetical protein
MVFLYSDQVNGLYLRGFAGETISGSGDIKECNDGAPKKIIDCLAL